MEIDVIPILKLKILHDGCEISEDMSEKFEENCKIILNAFEMFLDLTQGRKFKDINASGKLDVVVSHEGK